MRDVEREIGRKLKRARERAGLTQQELATILGLQSKVSVHGYEKGATPVPLDVLVRLPSILGVSIAGLLPDSVLTDHDRAHVADPALSEIITTWPRLHPDAQVHVLDAVRLLTTHTTIPDTTNNVAT